MAEIPVKWEPVVIQLPRIIVIVTGQIALKQPVKWLKRWE
jgi:hypothetical protein